ncbi:hypothetical protein DB347_17865 [Opitutaceae bacterium EW11]|nr:hypothetical protein DB347_17865 [Opitutaceae bacterium EW11]
MLLEAVLLGAVSFVAMVHVPLMGALGFGLAAIRVARLAPNSILRGGVLAVGLCVAVGAYALGNFAKAHRHPVQCVLLKDISIRR